MAEWEWEWDKENSFSQIKFMGLPTLHYIPLDYYLCSYVDGDVSVAVGAATAAVSVVFVVAVVEIRCHCTPHFHQIITHTERDWQKALRLNRPHISHICFGIGESEH